MHASGFPPKEHIFFSFLLFRCEVSGESYRITTLSPAELVQFYAHVHINPWLSRALTKAAILLD